MDICFKHTLVFRLNLSTAFPSDAEDFWNGPGPATSSDRATVGTVPRHAAIHLEQSFWLD